MGRFCDKCGSPINDNAAFCEKCGNQINNTQQNNVQFIPNNVNAQAPKAKKKHGCLIGVGVFVLLAIIIGIAGGNNDEPSTAERTVPEATTAVTTTAKPTETTTTTTAAAQPEETKAELKTGFDEKTNIEIKNGGLIYHLPNYYKEIENTDDKTVKYKYTEDDGSYVSVSFGYVPNPNGKELDEELAKKLIQGWIDNMNLGDEITVNKLNQDPILGRTEYEFSFSGSNDDFSLRGYMSLLENKDNNYINYHTDIIYRKSDDPDYDYLADLDKMFYSIEIDEDYEYETTEDDKSNEDEIREAVTNGDYSLVTPEFRESMDAYEECMDEYIDMMYNADKDDDAAMLMNMATILENYQEWTQKIEAIDETKLSPADDAYYLLVTSRVTAKMLKYVALSE